METQGQYQGSIKNFDLGRGVMVSVGPVGIDLLKGV